MGRWTAWRQILRDFSGWTSAHGVPHIASAQNIGLRVFWSVVFLFSCVMFSLQLYELVDRYFDYGVVVQTEVLRFEERAFPAVTICHLNPLKLDRVQNESTLLELLRQYESAVKNHTLAEAESWGFAGAESDVDTNYLAQRWSSYLSLRSDHFDSMAYSKEDLVMNCAYNTKPCEEPDFKLKVDPLYGHCYTFNHHEKYKSSRAGPLYGLRLLVRSDQRQYLPYVQAAGLRVAVHGHDEEPFPDAFGYSAAPGFATSFGIKFIKTRRLAEPYGQCTDAPIAQPYYYEGGYLVEGCFRSCLQDRIVRECGCADAAYALPTTAARACNDGERADLLRALECIESVSTSASNDADAFNVITGCNCPQPCHESTYSVTVSTALWPSDVYKPPECSEVQSQVGFWEEAGGCLEWYKKNTLLVEVYYERMNYQLLSESEAYGIVNLVSDMGGQLGLWLGVSVITVIEFLSLLVILGFFCAARSDAVEGNQPQPVDDIYSIDTAADPAPPSVHT